MQSEFSKMVEWNIAGICVAHQDSSNLCISFRWASKIAGGCHSMEPVCRVGCCISKLYRCLRAEVMVWADLRFCVWMFWRWLYSTRWLCSTEVLSCVRVSCLVPSNVFYFSSVSSAHIFFHLLYPNFHVLTLSCFLVNLAWSQMPLSLPALVFSSKLSAW